MTQPAAARKRPSIRGGSAAAGALSRMTLAKLLGIAVPGAKWRIESALWTESGVRVAVRFGKRKPILFSIEPRQDDSRGVVMTDHLAVSYQGKDLPAALARRVASMGAKNLAGHDMDSLAEIFTSDPEFGKGEAPVPDTGAMSNRPDSLLDSWGDSTAWADFFAVDELARGNLDSLDNLFVFVQHGDIECEHLFPHGPAPVLSLVSYPWDHRVRTERSPPPRNEGGGMMLTSELNEDDVIRGNPEKLRRLIEAGVREAEKRGSTLFVSNTCVPVVTGEDVESEFRRCTAGCSKDALYLTIGPSSMVNVFQDLLVERRLRAEQRVETQGPHIVNLLGFPETRDLEELRTLLCDAGIEVNVVLVPGVSEEIVDSLPRAALNVIRPTSAWEHLYEHVTKDSRIPSLRPVAPYGMERSREWLFEIAKALDVGAEEAWDRCYAPLAGRWERLCEEASRYRVGLVVRANEIHNVLEPATTWGVSILGFLEELGMGLDVLLMFEQPEQVKTAKRVHEAFAHPERHSIKGFDTLDRMLAQLRAMPAQLVFSHHTFDWRVTQAGKNILSLQQFEAGPQGAVRTADRIVNLCRTPFFRHFAPYLKRTNEGERLPHGAAPETSKKV